MVEEIDGRPAKLAHKSRALQRWRAACERWRWLLWCNDMDMVYEVEDSLEKNGEKAVGGYIPVAEADVKTAYNLATLKANSSNVLRLSARKLDEVAAHEMLHVVTAPLVHVAQEAIHQLPKEKQQAFGSWLDNEKERVVSKMERILCFPNKEMIAHLDKRYRERR